MGKGEVCHGGGGGMPWVRGRCAKTGQALAIRNCKVPGAITQAFPSKYECLFGIPDWKGCHHNLQAGSSTSLWVMCGQKKSLPPQALL